MNVRRNESCSDDSSRRALWSLCGVRRTRISIAYLSLFLIMVTGFGQQPKSLANRIAAAHALYEEQNQSDLRNFPLNATIFGDYRYNDKLTDYSLNGYSRRNEIDKAFLTRIEAISTEGFSNEDRLSHDAFLQILRQRMSAKSPRHSATAIAPV